MAVGDFLKRIFGATPKEVAEKAEHFAGETFEKAKVAAAPMIGKVEEFVEIAKEKVNGHLPIVKENFDNAAETLKDKAIDYADKAEEMGAKAMTSIKNAFANDASKKANDDVKKETNRVEEDAD